MKLAQAREHPGHPAGAIISSLPCSEPHGELEETVKWPILQLRGTPPDRIISPASCCNCRADVTASSHSIVRTQCPGGRVNSRADSGAPTYSRNRGWCSCNPYVGYTSAISTLSYDVIRYEQPGRLFNTMGTSPTTDIPESTSNGPSRDKSAGTESNWVSEAVGDDPAPGRGGKMQSSGSGNSGSGSRGRS